MDKAKETRQRNAAAKAEAARVDRQALRQAVIDRYGSKAAARAPTDRERAILDAGEDFDRRRDAGELADGESRNAHNAWPMPATWAEALAEQAEWLARDAEFADLDAADDRPTPGGSLPPDLRFRAENITNLVEHEMPLRTVAEIHDRLARFIASRETHDDYAYLLDFVVGAVERDLAVLAEADARAGGQVSVSVQSTTPGIEARIADTLNADPSASDRSIARQLGCSPTTVGKVRDRLGLMDARRSVRRGGQIYTMARGHSAT